MAFVYDRAAMNAVDKERNISVHRAVRLWGDTDPPVYQLEYASPDVSFNCGFLAHTRRQKYILNGKEIERPVTVAIEILETSIKSALTFPKDGKLSWPLTNEQFEALKADLLEGAFELFIPRNLGDGSILVPDFKVSFIQHVNFTSGLKS